MTEVKSAESDFGPTCPFCSTQFTPDEASYYNESGYELTCDNCEGVFLVRPACSWWWHTKAKTFEDPA